MLRDICLSLASALAKPDMKTGPLFQFVGFFQWKAHKSPNKHPLNTAIQVVFATVQSFFIALVMERDFSRWKLRLDVGLVAIIYCVSMRIPSTAANHQFIRRL
jgi:hypothetical protein